MRRRQFIGLKRRQAMAGYVFLAPIIIGLVWLFLPALLQAWQYSVSDIRMTAEGIELTPIGLEHYRDILFVNRSAPYLLDSLRTMAVQVPVIIIFSFFLSNVLNQQFGLSVPIGSAIAVVLSVGTSLLGLRKMVDIIGKIGPVVVGFSLILGIVSAFWTFPHISEGAELVQSGAVHVNRAGHSVFLSALSYTGTCILLPMAYVAHLGHDLRGYRYKDTKAVMLSSSFSYSACCVILGLNYLGNIAECSVAAIPNLILANHIIGGAGIVFSIIIILAIYSTMCPILWTCASVLWEDEKSLPYRLFIIACGVIVYFVVLFIPYEALINYIMTYFGYAGALSGVIIVVRYFMLKSQDKKAAAAAEA